MSLLFVLTFIISYVIPTTVFYKCPIVWACVSTFGKCWYIEHAGGFSTFSAELIVANPS